jgi:hypothetical protein
VKDGRMKTFIGLLIGFALLVACFAFDTAVEAQQNEQKSWTEWSQKEVQQMLSDSPWAQTQKEADTTEMFFQPTADPRFTRAPNSRARLEEGATNQEVVMTYGIRFFSARPVRQAFMRQMQLQQKTLDPDVLARMRNFAEVPASDSIIVAVTVDSTDQRARGKAMQLIESAATGTLKNTTYLERKDGKRLFLEEYVPPGRDGFGARFIFPRMVDERPFLTPEVGEVRFVTEFGPAIKLNMRFKLADMMLDGKLEY